jgi:hypothetical protein
MRLAATAITAEAESTQELGFRSSGFEDRMGSRAAAAVTAAQTLNAGARVWRLQFMSRMRLAAIAITAEAKSTQELGFRD